MVRLDGASMRQRGRSWYERGIIQLRSRWAWFSEMLRTRRSSGVKQESFVIFVMYYEDSAWVCWFLCLKLRLSAGGDLEPVVVTREGDIELIFDA